MFLGLHLRHAEQMGQQIQSVESSQPGQSRQGLRDERNGFIRIAIADQLVDSRPPIPDWRSAPPFTQCFFQKYASESAIYGKIFF
jgi:hypothetical protein